MIATSTCSSVSAKVRQFSEKCHHVLLRVVHKKRVVIFVPRLFCFLLLFGQIILFFSELFLLAFYLTQDVANEQLLTMLFCREYLLQQYETTIGELLLEIIEIQTDR